MQSREIRLKKRPQGVPTPDCFELATVELPALRDGQVRVENLWMSVDPYMRGRMDEGDTYLDAFALDAPLDGSAIGRVVESRTPRFEAGDHVESMLGWREGFVAEPGDGTSLFDLQKRDVGRIPARAYLSVAGVPGLTAQLGLDVVQAKEGDTVFVSAAAGAVGSVACQLAKIRGCRVVASAGSAEKIEWLEKTAGVDAAFDYKTVSSVREALAAAAPEGIDVDFENVGGEHLMAALDCMNPQGRVALCGTISGYNTPVPMDGYAMCDRLIDKAIAVHGFLVTDHWDRYPAFVEQMAAFIAEGRVQWQETVLEGIERAPEAFLGLFSGRNIGKMLVRLAGDA